MRSTVQRSCVVALAASGQAPSLQTRFAAWLVSGSFWHAEHQLYITKDLRENSYLYPLNGLSVQWPFCEANTAVTWVTVLFRVRDWDNSPGAGPLVIPACFHSQSLSQGGQHLLWLTSIKWWCPPWSQSLGTGCPSFCPSLETCLLSCLQPQGCLGRSPGVVKLQANLFVNSENTAGFLFLCVGWKWCKNSPATSYSCISASNWTRNKGLTVKRAMFALEIQLTKMQTAFAYIIV